MFLKIGKSSECYFQRKAHNPKDNYCLFQPFQEKHPRKLLSLRKGHKANISSRNVTHETNVRLEIWDDRFGEAAGHSYQRETNGTSSLRNDVLLSPWNWMKCSEFFTQVIYRIRMWLLLFSTLNCHILWNIWKNYSGEFPIWLNSF